ncbi:MAG: restriction endonuclease subunit S [Candidatus Gastranaerophilaceae bacterium]|jgi:type I restriction enzyme S subunit
MNNWKLVRLEEVAESINAGGTPYRKEPTYWENGTIPWLKISDLKSKYVYAAEERITKIGLENSSAKLFPKDTVLYSIFATIGAIGILKQKATANQAIVGIVPNQKIILLEYLYYCLLSEKNKIYEKRSHATQDNINLTILRNHKIPLPPISIQKKIVSVLEKAEKIKEKRKQAKELSDVFLKNMFLDLFGFPVKNKTRWPIGKIGNLVTSVNYGSSKKADENNGKYPILRMNNITYSGDIDFTNLKYIDFSDGEVEKYILKKGDIVFNRTNSKELVGKTAVYNSNKVMTYAGYLIRIRTNEHANPEYISAFLNSEYGKVQLQSMCKSIIGMANINAKELQKIIIQLPPIELQNKFALEVKKIRKLKEQQTVSEFNTEKLFSSLMQKAFKGDLING